MKRKWEKWGGGESSKGSVKEGCLGEGEYSSVGEFDMIWKIVPFWLKSLPTNLVPVIIQLGIQYTKFAINVEEVNV